MKKKIVGIIICMLIIAPVVQLTATTTTKTVKLNRDMIDQSMEVFDECVFVENYAWQQFIPTKSLQTKVDVMVCQHFSGSPDLTLSIQRPLGNVLTSKNLPATQIPAEICDWVTYDIPDVALIPGDLYYIVLDYNPGGEYSWGGAYGNNYEPGKSSRDPPYPDWDYCFRTFVVEPDLVIPILNLTDIKGGLFGISVLLKNFGNGTADNIHWEMNVSDAFFFYPKYKNGDLGGLGPGQYETIKISPIFGLGKATITLNCVYSIVNLSCDIEVKQEWRDQAILIFHSFPGSIQPTKEWVAIENYTYFDKTESTGVELQYENICNCHNVRVVQGLSSFSQEVKYLGACKFTNGTGILEECGITEDLIIGGYAHWEVELVDDG